jgi:hypothetical protein
VLSFDDQSLSSYGLMDSQGFSRVSYIVTGPLISVTVYSNAHFQNLRQLTVGPSSTFVLQDYKRLEAVGGGILDTKGLKDNNPTWDGEVYSLVLNSWSLCNTESSFVTCPQFTTLSPISLPTPEPSAPTFAPIIEPTFMPTYEPTVAPSWLVSPFPTAKPTKEPTYQPTRKPTPLEGVPTPEPTLADRKSVV